MFKLGCFHIENRSLSNLIIQVTKRQFKGHNGHFLYFYNINNCEITHPIQQGNPYGIVAKVLH